MVSFNVAMPINWLSSSWQIYMCRWGCIPLISPWIRHCVRFQSTWCLFVLRVFRCV